MMRVFVTRFISMHRVSAAVLSADFLLDDMFVELLTSLLSLEHSSV